MYFCIIITPCRFRMHMKVEETDKIFSKYNQLWKAGEIAHPLCIMVGGNIGTGKSTLANRLLENLSYCNLLPTGIVRSILQSMDLGSIFPELYGHSYQLNELVIDSALSEEQKAVVAFAKQLGVVDKAIRRILDFSQSEGQQYILDGNHISPRTAREYADRQPNFIGVFFKTTDVNQYRENVSGPTHQRTLSGGEFMIVRAIHDFIVTEAEHYQLPVFEYNQQKEAMNYVTSRITIAMETK